MHDGVVIDDCLARTDRAVLSEERDGGGVIFIEEIVENLCSDHTVEIECGSSAGPVFPNRVVVDATTGADPIAALALVCINLNTDAKLW